MISLYVRFLSVIVLALVACSVGDGLLDLSLRFTRLFISRNHEAIGADINIEYFLVLISPFSVEADSRAGLFNLCSTPAIVFFHLSQLVDLFVLTAAIGADSEALNLAIHVSFRSSHLVARSAVSGGVSSFCNLNTIVIA